MRILVRSDFYYNDCCIMSCNGSQLCFFCLLSVWCLSFFIILLFSFVRTRFVNPRERDLWCSWRCSLYVGFTCHLLKKVQKSFNNILEISLSFPLNEFTDGSYNISNSKWERIKQKLILQSLAIYISRLISTEYPALDFSVIILSSPTNLLCLCYIDHIHVARPQLPRAKNGHFINTHVTSKKKSNQDLQSRSRF